MRFLGFEYSQADPDGWMRESVRKYGSNKYYEYVLLYTDECLVISDRGENVLRMEIGTYFNLKKYSIGPPTQYLGGKLREVELENGQKCWAFGLKEYVEAVVKNVIEYLKKRGEGLIAKAATPITSDYRSDIDITPELGEEDAAYFHFLICVLRWIVAAITAHTEIGRASCER